MWYLTQRNGADKYRFLSISVNLDHLTSTNDNIMSWLQVSINATKQIAESVEAVLLSAGALSITLKDAADEPILEPEIGTTPLWENAIITGLFDNAIEQNTLIARLQSELPKSCEILFETLDDKDWTRAWMDNYTAMQFGQRLWVCPWHLDPPDPKAINLRLDPGLAFGTGTHPTTALCLAWLDKNIKQQKNILDYGCGSGILAIAALLLGAEHADGVDIDEQAIIATIDNMKANAVESQLNAMTVKSFQKVEKHQEYDIVLANILSGPLVELAPTLQTYVKKDGDIVLSGILQEQAEATQAAYAQYFEMDEIEIQEDWVLLHGRKIS